MLIYNTERCEPLRFATLRVFQYFVLKRLCPHPPTQVEAHAHAIAKQAFII